MRSLDDDGRTHREEKTACVSLWAPSHTGDRGRQRLDEGSRQARHGHSKQAILLRHSGEWGASWVGHSLRISCI